MNQEKLLWCARCKTDLPFSAFVKANRYPKRGCGYTCKPCVKEKSRIDRTNGLTLRFTLNRFGSNLAEYTACVAFQSGVCAICKRKTPLVIDHDHKTGKFRGLLCRIHNQALGMFEDNPDFLENAKLYLEYNFSKSSRQTKV